jgi:hypothetical protein
MLRIEGEHGTIWYAAVIPDDTKHEYRVALRGHVPWHLWIGERFGGQTGYDIYAGDHPSRYASNRARALEIEECSELTTMT